MTANIRPLYVGALRMKAGELMGVRDLAPDVADRILPRFIVPPQSERENELQARLFSGERFPDISAALTAHWRQREALIETTYLIDEFGRGRLGLWLPRLFESARKADSRPIPLATVHDLLRNDLSAYKACIDTDAPLKFGIVFSSGNLADSEFVTKALDAIGKLGLGPEDCIVVADFHDADFSNPDLVAPVIAGIIEMLRSSAQWQHIVFQGTNYPETNPADPDNSYLVPRNEWIAWRKAIRLEPAAADYAIFGDYAADCAKIAFKDGGSAGAIRHYRYATSEAWLVQRGSDFGTHNANMRKVCQEIISSGQFAGRTFSSADDYIFRTASSMGGPGGAKEWRAVNTTHHITRVVADIGTILGIEIKRRELAPLDDQMALFAKE